MHAGAPAPPARRGGGKAQARRARGAHALRRRRRDLHRRPFLHPALRLSVAHRQAEPRSAAHRSGGERDRDLRRLRPVRRGRARCGPVPVVLSRRPSAQPGLARPHAASLAPRRHRLARRPLRGRRQTGGGGMTAGTAGRPITILIAALGGEGGGVLTNWIVAAAAKLGLPAQSTSIPGVAQRTGATTYYIEIVPTPWRELGDRRPILALSPGIGDVDLVVASELLEAGRAIADGFVTPGRTTLIGSTSRSYLVVEKMAMGDGRYDSERVVKAIEQHARTALLFDMEAMAR